MITVAIAVQKWNIERRWKMIKYACDKCGKEMQKGYRVSIDTIDREGFGDELGVNWFSYELCEDCIKPIKEMIGLKEIQK